MDHVHLHVKTDQERKAEENIPHPPSYWDDVEMPESWGNPRDPMFQALHQEEMRVFEEDTKEVSKLIHENPYWNSDDHPINWVLHIVDAFRMYKWSPQNREKYTRECLIVLQDKREEIKAGVLRKDPSQRDHLEDMDGKFEKAWYRWCGSIMDEIRDDKYFCHEHNCMHWPEEEWTCEEDCFEYEDDPLWKCYPNGRKTR